ncbi:MAG: ComEA family DNA-binding protein, partial [Actinomycetota bacterium]|nr:ComEA family DNA-binding protein [Actinomycetota bacterium]
PSFASASSVGGGVPSGPTASGGTAGSSRLVIDVAGRVRHPGIVELPPGSRVVDAIAAAGGARPGVPLTSLNLARLLVDGEQIVVGIRVPVLGGSGPSGGSGVGGSTTGGIASVALNTATADQLDTLPGIGPVTAQAILQWRADNGPFTSVDELLEVSGIGDATLSDIRPYVYV